MTRLEHRLRTSLLLAARAMRTLADRAEIVVAPSVAYVERIEHEPTVPEALQIRLDRAERREAERVVEQARTDRLYEALARGIDEQERQLAALDDDRRPPHVIASFLERCS